MDKLCAVLFDMDGLLLDTEKLLIKYWCEASRELGFKMQKRHALHIRSLAGKWAEPYLKSELGEDFDYVAVRSRRKELMNADIVANGIEVKDGAFELLDYLKTVGIKRAVCTATDLERARWYLEMTGLIGKFDEIICAPMVENGKPAPDVYLFACSRINERPTDCIALEDSPNGVLSAFSAGLNVIMVPDLTEPTDDDRSRIIGSAKSLADVIEIIQKLERVKK